jgi:hypothetical protein
MSREIRRAACFAISVLAALPAGAEKPPAPAECEKGTTGPVEITLRQQEGQCVAVEPIPTVCVERGKQFIWKVTNQDCRLDEGATAIEFTEPEPRAAGKKQWKYEGCKPRQNGFQPGKTMPVQCRVPKDAEPGLYKYGLKGQIKTIDPDIEVRSGR